MTKTFLPKLKQLSSWWHTRNVPKTGTLLLLCCAGPHASSGAVLAQATRLYAHAAVNMVQNVHDIDGHLACCTCKAAKYMMTRRDSVHLPRPLRQAGWRQSPQWGCIMSCSHNMRSTNSSALAMSAPLLAAPTTCSTWACRASQVSPCRNTTVSWDRLNPGPRTCVVD